MESENKILLFGGTFDPIHVGHLTMAQEAIERLVFNKVIFIPSATPLHKKDVLSFTHRLKMTQEAVKDIDCFNVSDIEGQRAGPSYTIDTVRDFREKLEEDVDVYWLIGTDIIPELKTWHKIKELVKECKFVIAERSPYKFYSENTKNLFNFLATETKKFLNYDITNHFIPLVNPVVEISSTDIRNKLFNNNSIKFLVPEKVEQYIDDNQLYTNK